MKQEHGRLSSHDSITEASLTCSAVCPEPPCLLCWEALLFYERCRHRWLHPGQDCGHSQWGEAFSLCLILLDFECWFLFFFLFSFFKFYKSLFELHWWPMLRSKISCSLNVDFLKVSQSLGNAVKKQLSLSLLVVCIRHRVPFRHARGRLAAVTQTTVLYLREAQCQRVSCLRRSVEKTSYGQLGDVYLLVFIVFM